MAAKFEAALRSWNQSPAPLPTENWRMLFVNGAKSWGAATLAGILFIAVLAFFGPRYWRMWRGNARLRQIIRSGGSPSDASVLYERMLEVLARRGFHKPSWFTPSEFARHLPVSETGVGEFTEVYNSIRFGGDRSATSRLAQLLQEFERTSHHRPVDHLHRRVKSRRRLPVVAASTTRRARASSSRVGPKHWFTIGTCFGWIHAASLQIQDVLARCVSARTASGESKTVVIPSTGAGKPATRDTSTNCDRK